MIKIKDILSIKERRAILLEDDDSNFGGVAFEGEALQDIIEDEDIDVTENSSVNELQHLMTQIGVREIREVDDKVDELIQQKIWDIEEEFQISIHPWAWDYKR